MSMYKRFGTDKTLEAQGVWLDYGDFRVKIARAGGSNRAYQRALEVKTRPHRRAIQTNTLSQELADRLLREVFAEAIVLEWQVRDGTGWRTGIETPTGEVAPATAANITEAFMALPDLFYDVQEQANTVSLFQAATDEADAGN